MTNPTQTPSSSASTDKEPNTWLGFSLRDIVDIAIFAALAFVGMCLGGPLHAIKIFGIQTLLTGPFITFFSMFALIKIRKPGTVVLLSLISTIILIPMHPTAFIYSVIAAVFAEIIALGIFRTYENRAARLTSSILRSVLQLPVQIVYTLLVVGNLDKALVGSTLAISIVLIVGVLLFIGSALLAEKVAAELRKSGRMR
ncbi:MptD family putative ECF transporter S component [Alloscardovia omnicolens]|uniref:Uncharacterized protein n=1 Tax=Alloscardovia omnicolens TaxID=419015 RepID=A0A2I1M851_9BIFI|nr:MptD family putative ECF transporter S component [Alloscardovia omnicolens]MBS6346760.1 MptD family putative ECF transporter S component [Alloscardovia omnicolens]MDK6251443.1 MptD family putative ECF transporter S component [Alloscardovia omnicolens]MDU6532886.1 MptD family putative ECF transporter S component [Alloscardovia omnicolens]PKZ16267.1 hypothetical protein CYJ32_02255 [Alloscardovia omnicolens]